MMRRWCSQADGQVVSTRRRFRNIIVVSAAASTLTFKGVPVAAKLSAKAQGVATQTLGGTELISPFSLDNLAVDSSTRPAVKPTEKGEEE